MTGNDWVACPHCGEKIKRSASACRHCGSDDRTGWSQATYLDGIDLPEAEDYGDALEAEGFRKPKGGSRNFLAAGISLVLIALFALWLSRSLW